MGGGGGGVKALLRSANFTLGPDATLNTEIHKNSVRLKAPNSVSAKDRYNMNAMRQIVCMLSIQLCLITLLPI